MLEKFIFYFIFLFGIVSCQNKAVVFEDSKLKGVCFVAPPREIEASEFENVKNGENLSEVKN
jgi:hypothetical protein